MCTDFLLNVHTVCTETILKYIGIRYSNALQCGLGPIYLYMYLYSHLHLYLYLYLGLSVWWPAGVLARREGAFPVSLAWKVKNDPSIDSHPHKVRPQYLAALI